VNGPVTCPLSASQMAIWLDIHFSGLPPTAYNLVSYVDIQARHDEDAALRACRLVAVGVPTLNAEIALDDDGTPYQRIHSSLPVPYYRLDFSASADPAQAARNWMLERAATAFEFSTPPLYEYGLLKLASDHYIGYSRYHHLIIDGFGMSAIGRCIAATYTAIVRNEPLPSWTWQSMPDYLREQARYRRSPHLAEDREYWRGMYPVQPAVPSISKRTRSEPPDWRFVDGTAAVPADALVACRRHATALQVSFNEYLIGAAVLYLHEVVRQPRVHIGLVTHGRSQATREFAGAGLQVIALPIDLPAGVSADEAIRTVVTRVAEGLSHSRYRVEEIRRDLKSMAPSAPLYTITLNILPNASLQYGDVLAKAYDLGVGPIWDLWLYQRTSHVGDRGLTVNFLGNEELYDHQDLGELAAAYTTHLERLVHAGSNRGVRRTG
jgi:hypothetical protein